MGLEANRRFRGKPRLARFGVASIVAVGGMMGLASSASGAPITPPTLPTVTVPPQLGPVLKLLSPSVSPECGNLGLTAALILPALGGKVPGGLPVDPVPLFAPILDICGAVPAPGQTLTCTADSTIADLASQGITSLLGTEDGLLTKILDLSFFGQITEEVYVLQAVAPSQLQGINLGTLAQNALHCTVVTGPTAPRSAAPPSIGSETPPLVGSGPLTSSALASPTLPTVASESSGTIDSTPSNVSSPGSSTSPSSAGQSAVALPKSTDVVSELISPSSTIAQGGAVIGFLLLLSGAVAIFMRSRRSVLSGADSAADGDNPI
jgi:hypothetical protein